MLRGKGWAALSAVLLFGFGLVVSAGAQAGYSSVTQEGISLQWKVNGANLDLILSAPTDGWVAVGFKPSSKMKDANFLIGHVDARGAHVRDDFGNGALTHKSDESLGGRSNVLNAAGSEQGKKTELRFSIPLDSGDKYDQPLKAGEQVTVLLAYGPGSGDGFSAYHTRRAKVQIKV